MAKTSKATRKFAAGHHLDRVIRKRKTGLSKKRKRGGDAGSRQRGRDGARTGKAPAVHHDDERKEEETTEEETEQRKQPQQSRRTSTKAVEDLNVDEFMDVGLLDDADDDDDGDDPAVLETGSLGEVDAEAASESDAASDAEEEEDDGDAEDPEAAERRLLAEIDEHEQEMRALAKSDPAFYRHLQENDAELLHFNKEAVLRGGQRQPADDQDEDGGDDKKTRKKASKEAQQTAELSMAAWRVVMQQVKRLHSVTALRKALRLFRAAVHSTDDEKTGEETSTATVRLASSPVYQDVIRFAITDLPAVFSHHLSLPASSSSSSSAPSRKLSSHPRWSVLGPLLQSYLTQFLHLLLSQSDPALLRLLLDTLLNHLVPLLDPFPRLPPRLLKRLVFLWATADRSTRIDAFLCIRQLCLTLTRHGVLELAMKSLYLTYVQRARQCSAMTIGVLELMINCLTELYCMDAVSAYQHAFVYIRQLAIHLRNAIHSGKGAGRGAAGGKAGGPDAGADDGEKAAKRGKQKRGGAGKAAATGSYAAVYNWQFINCLRLWTKLLSSPLAAHPVVSTSSSSPPPVSTLRPLLYPFVQVCLGVATLLPSSRYHPLRLQVCAFLTSLSASCHLFIPVLPVLLSLFTSSELTRRPSSSSSSTKSPDLRFCLRVSKQTAASLAYQQQLSSLALQSILRYCAVHSYSLSFCELILPTTRFLRRWCRQSRIVRLRKEITAVVAQLEHSAEWLREKRERSDWTPKDALDGKVDSMYAFRTDGKDDKQRSPLERYLAMDRGTAGDGRVDDDDIDWEGAATQGKRGPEEDDDEAADEEEEDEDGEMDVDMDDDDEEEEEKEEVATKKRRKTAQKPGAAAAAGSQKGGGSTRSQSQQPKQHTKPQAAADAAAAEGDEDIVTELVLSDDDDD